ncbi:MAG TPA: PAS domain S-box protein, partial [Flavisolibacter sp.]
MYVAKNTYHASMSMKDAEGKSTFSALKQVVAQLPVAVLVFNPCGHLLSANKTVGTLMGYAEEEIFHVVPPVFSETFTPEELSKTYTILLRHPEQPVTVSSSLVHKDGSKLACSLRFSLLQENQDRCILVTISREKQENNKRSNVYQLPGKKAVLKTEAVSAILEQITDGFTAYDNDWNYTYLNQRAAEIANRTPADLLGKNVWQEFPELIGTSLYHTYHKAVKEQVVIRTEEYVALFQKWFEGALYPSADGLSVFFQDITEKKKAELALKEQELLYRTIVETSQEGIWQVDAENRTTFVNTFLQTLLGYTKEEMTGRPFLDFMTEEARPLALTLVEKRKKGVAEQHEFTFLRKDGRLLPTLVQSTPIIQNGQYAGAVAMVLDNTKRKKAEEQLRESEAKYRKAQAQGKLGHWEWAALTGQLTWSDEIYAMFGLNPETHIPDYEKFLNCLYTDDRPAVENKISQALANGTGYDLMYRIVLEDGSLRHVHMIAEPVKNTPGELVKMVG